MTPREKGLLTLLGVTAGAALVLVGVSSTLQGLTDLDQEWDRVRHQVVTAALKPPAAAPSVRAYAPGTLPSPLSLAEIVSQALAEGGLEPGESQVVEATDKAQWVRFTAHGTIEAWFRTLRVLRTRDERVVFRTVSLAEKDGSYSLIVEVGRVVVP